MMKIKIIHDKDKHTVKTEIDGYTAYVKYRINGTKLDIIHTLVPPPLEGKGIASALVKYAYDYALENGLTPYATCSYAVTWLLRHPEYEK